MSIIAIILVLTGVLAMAGHGLAQRYVLREGILDKKTVLISQHGISALLLLTALFWWPALGNFSVWPQIFWLAVLGTTLFNIIIQFANARSRELADMSLTAPVSAMTPMLVTVAALALKEYPSPQGIAGIILISAGTFWHLRAGFHGPWYLPFVRFIKLPHNFNQLPPTEQQIVKDERRALRWLIWPPSAAPLALSLMV
jgi:drug/metabolite transporter (DMT)-like permease